MKSRYIVLILLLVIAAMVAGSTAAQDNTIEITGTVEGVSDGGITVNGLTINIDGLDTTTVTQIVPGATIHLTGNLQNGVVIAITIDILTLPLANEASIKLEKSVSVNSGNTWQEADEEPGPAIEPGTPVSFRLRVTNDGDTELTNLALSDDGYDVSACVLPAALAPGASVDCFIGPIDAGEGQQINTATVTAMSSDQTVTATDAAQHFGGTIEDDEDLPVTIVIEGPIQQINVNIITIYNIEVEVGQDDPILPVIRVGDEIRVEGNVADRGGSTIIIVAVNITIINVDIVIGDDNTVIWRDTGECSNPPPPWAPANGWRRKCEASSSNAPARNNKKDKDDDD